MGPGPPNAHHTEIPTMAQMVFSLNPAIMGSVIAIDIMEIIMAILAQIYASFYRQIVMTPIQQYFQALLKYAMAKTMTAMEVQMRM